MIDSYTDIRIIYIFILDVALCCKRRQMNIIESCKCLNRMFTLFTNYTGSCILLHKGSSFIEANMLTHAILWQKKIVIITNNLKDFTPHPREKRSAEWNSTTDTISPAWHFIFLFLWFAFRWLRVHCLGQKI